MSFKEKIYIFLTSLFCVILVTGNMIFQKFLNLNVLGITSFQISAGVLLYPLTFLITDSITEFYGKNLARLTVKISLISSLLVSLLTYIADIIPATTWSPLDDGTYKKVFGVFGIATFSSLFANFIAQYVDIMIFDYVKKLTVGKYLWLRSNISTISAQFVDTITVLVILISFGIIPKDRFLDIFVDSFIFKFLSAVAFTPLFYVIYYFLSELFKKKATEK